MTGTAEQLALTPSSGIRGILKRHGWLASLLPIPLPLLSAELSSRPRALWLLWIVVWALWASMSRAKSRPLPWFQPLETRPLLRVMGTKALGSWLVIATRLAALGAVAWLWAPGRESLASVVAAAAALLVAGIDLLHLRGWFGPSVVTCRRLLAATPLPKGAPEGSWGAIEGSLVSKDGLEPLGLKGFVRFREAGFAVGGSQWMADGLELRCEGETFALEPSKDGLWGTCERTERFDATAFTRDSVAEQVGPGGAVLAVGEVAKVKGRRALVARGPGSLALFGAGPGEQAREVLERCVRRWTWMLAPCAAAMALAALAAVAAALG